MISDYFLLALNNLRQRGLRSWLTIFGIFIGIAAVVSLITLGNGLQTAITGQFSSLSVDTLTISNIGTGFGPPGSTVVEKLNEHDLNLVKEISGVNLIVPRLIRVVGVEYNDAKNFRHVSSVPQDKVQLDFMYTSIGVKAREGRLLDVNDFGKIVVGNDFLDEKIFDKTIKIGGKVIIEEKEFEVVGIMEKASTFIINGAIFMLEDDMKSALDINDEIDLIIARVSDREKIEEIGFEIEEEFRKDRNLDIGKEDFAVETPLEAVAGINDILNIVNLIVVGIAAISLIVGGIGITNTMYTSVIERTREIGIMKAVGARNEDVLMIFLIESGLLGFVGGAIGIILGLGLAFIVQGMASSFLEGIDLGIKISYPLIAGSLIFSFILGIFSGVLPALQASKLNVVDALSN